jgi:protein-disulfide isomerase
LKHNTEIFDNVLAQQKKITLPPDDMGLLMGNDNSTNKIVMVSNPTCIACQVAHKSIRELLLCHKNLKVQMLFTLSDKGNPVRNEFIRHIMALNEIDREKSLLALDEWYQSETKRFKEIENKFPLRRGVKYDTEKILEMDKWCREANISATPTFFIRGYQLPAFYNISDLSYLLA